MPLCIMPKGRNFVQDYAFFVILNIVLHLFLLHVDKSFSNRLQANVNYYFLMISDTLWFHSVILFSAFETLIKYFLALLLFLLISFFILKFLISGESLFLFILLTQLVEPCSIESRLSLESNASWEIVECTTEPILNTIFPQTVTPSFFPHQSWIR